MELVFETDWKAVQRTDGSFVLCEVCILLLGVFDGCIEENLVETANLKYVNQLDQSFSKVGFCA